MEICRIPEGYKSLLNVRETQDAIKYVKDTFERIFAESMELHRVSAPLFVHRDSGLNDNLSGVERPVDFDAQNMAGKIEIVQSLAKWKRMALARYGFDAGEGIYTDMNAIRRDDDTDNLHSIYVDQWDWERVITRAERTLAYLEDVVRTIVRALAATELATCAMFKQLTPSISPDLTFITAGELAAMYPTLSSKERENAITRAHRTVFIAQIGGALDSGEPHDTRAPDYDDWSLNGDILIWNDALGCALELSSMGIRVDEQALASQLEISGCQDRARLPFHRALLAGELPLTIGGGIGQSRMCMQILQKCHIGEVHASTWPAHTREVCEAHGVFLL
ncbi:MAG: aspartate--ammonia ligase [Christensenellales bacterium]|jgi:aspartate--ammonia ligase